MLIMWWRILYSLNEMRTACVYLFNLITKCAAFQLSEIGQIRLY